MTKIKFIILFGAVFISFLYLIGLGPFIKNASYYYFNIKQAKKINVDLTKIQISNIKLEQQNASLVTGEALNNDPSISYQFNSPIILKKVSFELSTKVKDDIQIFYLPEDNNNYTEMNSVKVAVKPGNQLVTINLSFFNLPRNIKSIRIDPSDKSNNFTISDVIIN